MSTPSANLLVIGPASGVALFAGYREGGFAGPVGSACAIGADPGASPRPLEVVA